jgi:two-component system response regulator AtoC
MDRDTNACLTSVVASLGYAVHTVRDGDELLTHVCNPEFEIGAVIVKITTSDQSVFDLLRNVRAIDSGLAVIVIAEPCSARDVVTAVKHGASDFLCLPADRDELERVLESALETSNVRTRNASREGKAVPAFNSNNPLLRQIELRAEKIGWSGLPVLIQGETGSGKEMLARVLHANSPRASRPFLKLNCAALPSELVESELFGYEKGAFTGAFDRKAGVFEVADGGTILLDEIGDMDVNLQAKLLQVLQDQEFRRIGGGESVKVDVRVIAATHRDLKAAISNKTFREDLYYRLNVVVLHVPSLRERTEDIMPLAAHLIRKHSVPTAPLPVISPELRKAMLAYSWPGNVRELENCIRSLLIFGDSDTLAADIRARMTSKPAASAHPAETRVITMERHEDMAIFEQVTRVNKQAETNAILSALNATRWNRKRAAAMLKIDYKSLLYRMKRLKIDERPAPVAAHSENFSASESGAALTGTDAG